MDKLDKAANEIYRLLNAGVEISLRDIRRQFEERNMEYLLPIFLRKVQRKLIMRSKPNEIVSESAFGPDCAERVIKEIFGGAGESVAVVQNGKLIGGCNVVFKDKRFDASIEHQLDRFHKQLM